MPDPRIATPIENALAGCKSVVNVGAGSGSYEPTDRFVVAVEPSQVMIAQRAADSAPVIRGRAEALPLRDRSFDAALGILTLHHWSNLELGLSECRRVARRRIVFLTVDLPILYSFWLFAYFPGLLEVDRDTLPEIERISAVCGPARLLPVSIPADCQDGFLGAYWKRPEAYLDPDIRSAISSFSRLKGSDLEANLASLRSDLESGKWAADHAELNRYDDLDIGYRLLVIDLT